MIVFLATNHEKTVLRVDVAQKLQMEPVVAAFRAGFSVQELFQFNPDRFHGLRVLGHEKHIAAVVADDVVITGDLGTEQFRLTWSANRWQLGQQTPVVRISRVSSFIMILSYSIGSYYKVGEGGGSLTGRRARKPINCERYRVRQKISAPIRRIMLLE